MFDALVVIVVGTSLWVLLDALRIGVRKGEISGFFDMGPFGWFFSCLLIWILAFPAYLAKRQLYIDAAAEVDNPQGSNFIPDQIERLGELRESGLLTDEEFQSKKADLLARM